MITTSIIIQNYNIIEIGLIKKSPTSTKDACYQDLRYKPCRIRTCDLADNGVIPVRLQFNTKKIPRNEGYYTELLTLYLKGERII
jgi:hypothetical protein